MWKNESDIYYVQNVGPWNSRMGSGWDHEISFCTPLRSSGDLTGIKKKNCQKTDISLAPLSPNNSSLLSNWI